jgi:hypothetical protein
MSGTFAELEQKKKKIQSRLNKMFAEHVACDQNKGFTDVEEKKIQKLKKSIEKIDRFLQANEPRPGKKSKENKSNVTDNDSHLMMTSHGVIQGYNAQAIVDSEHQVIVHADAGDAGQDDEHLSGMVEGAMKNLQAMGKDESMLQEATFLGDPNYHSQANLKTCVKKELDALFPNSQFRKTAPDKDQAHAKFSITDFLYNEQDDVYVCPAQKTLVRKSDIEKNGKPYYRRYTATKADCRGCPYQPRCLSRKNAKRRSLSVPHDKRVAGLAHTMEARMQTEEGRKLYGLRIGIVEPVFANIREQKRMDRFGLRGKVKVNIQWLLYCIVHNLEKVANNGYRSPCMAGA